MQTGPNTSRGSHPLYERWLEVARERKSDLALLDGSSGERWSFAGLLKAAENLRPAPASVHFPRGQNVAFLLSLLAAWRAGAAACPLEPGQAAPVFAEAALDIAFAHLKLTSGSTGEPKCVAFTAEQLAADPRNIVQSMGLRPDWPNLGAISLAHSYGFSNLVLPLLLHGIPLAILPAPLPEAVLSCAREFSSVTLPAVPALWRAWMDSGSIPDSVRLAISAGAPLSLDLERAVFERHGLKIHNFYGSTECGGIAFDRSDAPRENASLAGAPLENVRLSVGEAGLLVVEGDAVGSCYWPVSQAELGSGRFVASDYAGIASGLVFLRGRASDIINVAGRKVAPETIESALRADPRVRECVVFGAPARGEERCETIVAVVNASSPVPSAELKSLLMRRLPSWQIPRVWWFCADLEPNARGKIPRPEWRARYLAKR